MANELANLFGYHSSCYGAWINYHGLRHAGEMHSSILPDSAMVDDDVDVGVLQSPRHIGLGIYSACYGNTSSSADVEAHTPRTKTEDTQIGRLHCNCVVHENRLSVAKARWPSLVRGSLGGCDEERVSRTPGFKLQRPEQQPRWPHPPSCQRTSPWCRGRSSSRLHTALPTVRGALLFLSRKAGGRLRDHTHTAGRRRMCSVS